MVTERDPESEPPEPDGAEGVAVAIPSVFGYVDYRAFLRDHFQASKRVKRHWSYRYFARKAQLAAPNFLQLVMLSLIHI